MNLARSENVVSYVGALYNAHNPNVELIDEARRTGVRTVVFDSRGRIDLRTVLTIRSFIRENRIDILHTHGYKADIIGVFAALLANKTWMATNHVWHPMGGKMWFYETVDAFALRFARRIVAVSREIREELIAAHVRPARIRVIDNGIDIDRFARPRATDTLKAALGIDAGDVVVAIVGRLSPEKGHQAFLEAARHVVSRTGNVTFLIVGDGPMGEDLRAEAARLGLAERVVFAGFRTDMPEIYAVCDVMVNASSIEGLPMTILEAMAAKVPIIATRIGGTPDIITHDETGLLVDSQDVAALQEQMAALVADPKHRRRLAEAAFELVTKNHSMKRMCDAYRQVYSEVVHAA